MKWLARIVPVLVAIMLLQGGFEKKGSFDLTAKSGSTSGDVSAIYS